MGKFLIIFVGALAVFAAWAFYGPLGDTQAPTLPDYFWGPKSKVGQKEDTTIRPFSIKVDEKVLTDLKTRLKLETSADGNRLLPPLEGIGFQYGFNTNFLKKVTAHWLNKYDWRARETLLNKYSQFKTTISGIEVHFQHIKPSAAVSKKYKETRPLLLLHGWPGSFVEFQKTIPLLTEPKDSDINFELVIPSLPGYGFSERAHQPGLGHVQMAQIFMKLMTRLGYGEQFYVQGGDWGSAIATDMASLYPKKVAGVHMNMCLSMHTRANIRLMISAIYPPLFLDEDEISKAFPMSTLLSNLAEETGYMHLQATKPDTIGAGLSNSPTGLAAYLLEKFSGWTNLDWKNKEDGGLVPYFDLDELLDNVMVYWVTNSITSSMRLYSDSFNRETMALKLDNVPVQVPTGCMSSPKEFYGFQGQFHLRDKFPNLISFTKSSKGGHFTAFEIPQLFAKDVISFFNLVERNTTVSFPKTKKL